MEATIVPPIRKNRTTTLGRITGFISKDGWLKKVNLWSMLYEDPKPFAKLTHFALPIPEPPTPIHGSWKEWPFEKVVLQTFVPAAIGDSFGPTWATHWFKVELNVPQEWAQKEVHLRWVSGSEANVYSKDGKILQGLSPKFREEFPLPRGLVGPVTYYVEMACNHIMGAGPDFVNGWGDEITPTDPNLYFKLTLAEIAIFRTDLFHIYTDLEILHGMADKLGNTHIGYQALFVANQMVNQVKRGQIQEAKELASQFFAESPGQKAHELFAIGHCHIDTAWLWPYDETIRKCARAFSSQIRLMEVYPDYKFVCSQAQQLAWMKEYYPALFTEIKTYATKKQFIPVGGAWVEMDGNVPSGEAFMRQFLYGQRFYQQEFQVTCKEFWLPDTFGYSAQIPQIIRHVGIQRFLTQKMSWNLINTFPNHCFIWEGIDGSEVTCHFPPGNGYGMEASVDEIVRSRDNSLDKGRCNTGIFLYGHGDGGGGPTRRILERLQRVKNVDGLPKVTLSDQTTFFEAMETEKDKFYKWAGELYLELHNGTYTTQAKIKWYNRKGEIFFREVELLMSIAFVKGTVDMATITADMGILDTAWRNFLLNQFHDVLPGSCIQIVAEDAWAIYSKVFVTLGDLRTKYHTANLGSSETKWVVFNPLSWDVRTVVFIKPDVGPPPTGQGIQNVVLNAEPFEEQSEGRFRVPNEFSAALVSFKASGYSEFKPEFPIENVKYTPDTPTLGIGTFENGPVKLEVDTRGNIPYEQLYLNNGAVYKATPANPQDCPGLFYIFDDVPLIWDAWDVMDYHLESKEIPDFRNTTFQHLSGGPIVGIYKWTGEFGNGSSIIRYTIVRADSPMVEYYAIVDWKESHKILKVEFPLDLLARSATYDIQYGHLSRPTHTNTSWDMAKYEVCGHKWMDISQADRGVTIISDSKYGWHAEGSTVQLSLLRSPKNPDDHCDIHKHFIYWAVLPHSGPFQGADVIRRAYELNYLGSNNVPLLGSDLSGAELPTNWIRVSEPSVIVEAVKVSADIKKAICVRLYESFGGNAEVRISTGFDMLKVEECNGLEEKIGDVENEGNGFVALFRPFQIKSFLIYF